MNPGSVNLAHTPGIYYALAYWLSCTLYVHMNPRKLTGWRFWAVEAAFLPVIGIFMALTDNREAIWFFPCICVIILLLFLFIRLCCGMPPLKTGFFCVKAFILGEFAASLEWQLFYFGLTVLQLPMRIAVNLLFLCCSHGMVFFVLYLMERRFREGNAGLQISGKEFLGCAIIGLAVFLFSNLSFAFDRTPFSSQFPAEIFIIRTLADLGGLVMLYAYQIQLDELRLKVEMDYLQNTLQMQYNNTRITEESMALVDQKYHDLKHQISLLRSEVTSEEKLAYLDQMEQDVRSYETRNRTGNRILDAILATKGLQCQDQGITLTCVADGKALDFMAAMDLSALFGNALDNAIESVSKISDPEKRLIHVSVAQQKQFLRVRVENCFQGQLQYVNGAIATTKQDRRYHGFGMKSMNRIVEKYGGSMTVNTRYGWFELRLLFPLKSGTGPESSD